MVNSVNGGSTQYLTLQQLGIKQENKSLLENVNTEGQAEAQVFDTVEEALEHANRDIGQESIIQLESGKFAVVDLENAFKIPRELKNKLNIRNEVTPEALFDPDSGLKVKSIVTTHYNEIRVHHRDGEDLQQQVADTLKLAEIASENKVRGFKRSGAYNLEKGKMPTYLGNLSTVSQEIVTTRKALESKITHQQQATRDQFITALKSQLGKNPGDDAALKALLTELESNTPNMTMLKKAPLPHYLKKGLETSLNNLAKLQYQNERLGTHLAVLQTKMAILPPHQHAIPGSEQKVGELRNKTDQSVPPLKARKAGLEKILEAHKQAPDPKDISRIQNLQEQIRLLDMQIADVYTSTSQNKAAELAKRIRVGALATINQDIGKSTEQVQDLQKQLQAKHAELREAPTDAIKLGIEKDINNLEKKLNSTRTGLIKKMKAEIATYKNYAPKVSGRYQKGTKAIVATLELQIKKLEAAKGKSPTELKAILNEVHAEYKTSLKSAETQLLDDVNKAAKTFSGISPSEAKAVGDIAANTNKYLRAYASAKKTLSKLNLDVQAAKKMLMFQYSSKGQIPFEYKKLSEAKYWSPGSGKISGSEGNVQITQTYHEMDETFTRDYLGIGEHGTVPSWITFAKSGSGSAGAQIGNIESALEALQQISDGKLTGKDSDAAKALAQIVSQKDVDGQFALLIEKILNDGIEKGDFDVIDRGIKDIQRLRTALVEGNTEIYNNAVPLFRAFMEGESKGGKGLVQVKKMLQNPKGLWDTQQVKKQYAYHLGRKLSASEEKMVESIAKQNRDLIYRAFQGYQEAHRVQERAKLPSTSPTERAQLMKRHEALIRQANMDFVSFEQLFAQPIYNKIHDLTGAMTGTVKLFDANHPQAKGGQTLLPNLGPDKAYEGNINHAADYAGTSGKPSGNWGDWPTRMGFVEADENTPGARKLTVPFVARNTDGSIKNPLEMTSKTGWYAPDPKLTSSSDSSLTTRGTIADYFLTTKSGSETDRLIYGKPPMAQKNFDYKSEGNWVDRLQQDAVTPDPVELVLDKVHHDIGPGLKKDAGDRESKDKKTMGDMEKTYTP